MGLYEDWLAGSTSRSPFAGALANTEFVFKAMEWAFPNASVAYATTAGSATTATTAGSATTATSAATADYATTAGSAGHSSTADVASSVTILSDYIGVSDYGWVTGTSIYLDTRTMKPITFIHAKWKKSDTMAYLYIKGQREPILFYGALWNYLGDDGKLEYVESVWTNPDTWTPLFYIYPESNDNGVTTAINLMVFKPPFNF